MTLHPISYMEHFQNGKADAGQNKRKTTTHKKSARANKPALALNNQTYSITYATKK